MQAEPGSTIHLHRTLTRIRELEKKAGVVLDPASPPELIEYVLHLCDVILVMTVNPGFGGQAFIESQLAKSPQDFILGNREVARRVEKHKGRFGIGTCTYGQPLSAATLSGGSASVAGSFTFASPETTPNAGSYAAAVIFTPTSANYDSVIGSVI